MVSHHLIDISNIIDGFTFMAFNHQSRWTQPLCVEILPTYLPMSLKWIPVWPRHVYQAEKGIYIWARAFKFRVGGDHIFEKIFWELQLHILHTFWDISENRRHSECALPTILDDWIAKKTPWPRLTMVYICCIYYTWYMRINSGFILPYL